jgi:CheY-like chemotaxis protein
MPCVGTILIIDTDTPTREFLADALGEEGDTIWTAQSTTSVLAALALYRPDLVLLDLPLLGSTPLDPPAVPTAAASVQIAAPVLAAPEPGAQAAAGSITFSGTAAPGVQVQLLIDGAPAGTARAGADGTWTLNATVDKPGVHQVVVQALDDKDTVAASASPATLSIVAPLPQLAAPT